MPNTTIEGDPAYRVIDAKNIGLKKGERWQRYTKCTTDTKPVLDYSTMKDVPRESGITFFEPSQGLPNYEKSSPFIGRDPALLESLRRHVAAASVAAKYCEKARQQCLISVIDPYSAISAPSRNSRSCEI